MCGAVNHKGKIFFKELKLAEKKAALRRIGACGACALDVMRVTPTAETHSCAKTDTEEKKIDLIIIIFSVQEENPQVAVRKGYL